MRVEKRIGRIDRFAAGERFPLVRTEQISAVEHRFPCFAGIVGEPDFADRFGLYFHFDDGLVVSFESALQLKRFPQAGRHGRFRLFRFERGSSVAPVRFEPHGITEDQRNYVGGSVRVGDHDLAGPVADEQVFRFHETAPGRGAAVFRVVSSDEIDVFALRILLRGPERHFEPSVSDETRPGVFRRCAAGRQQQRKSDDLVNVFFHAG